MQKITYHEEKRKWEYGYLSYGNSIKNLTKIIKLYSDITGIPSEIAKYEFLKSRAEIISILTKYYNSRINNITIVDVGCGNLFLLEFLRNKSNARLIGLDITNEVFRIKKKLNLKNRLEVIVANAANLPFREDKIECIISTETLEHLIEIKNFLKELQRCLKHNGKLIITTPNTKAGFWKYFYLPHRFLKKKLNPTLKSKKPFENFVDFSYLKKLLLKFNFKDITLQFLFHHPGQNFFSFPSKLLNLILYNLFLKTRRIFKFLMNSYARLLLIETTKN